MTGRDRPRLLLPAMLIVIAVILAVAFFYGTKQDRRDDAADKVTNAAGSVDRAADKAGKVARDMVRKFRDPD